ncbi:HTTM domain-containing protein [Streptantibioticus ferralitis]|uniref:HTTM domain-containing protein n=1 Tax=Streptantibioticus ferralitis TaxID=236510 RepID=UPI003380C6C1
MTDKPAAGPRPSTGSAATVPSPFAGLLRGTDRAIVRGLARITGSAVAPYQSAVVRIGFSLTWLLFLVREWPHRSELYGPDSPWSWGMARALIGSNHAFSALMWSDSRLWFEVVYTAAIATSVMLLLGWRTRTASILFMVGVLALQNRSVFVGDGGDNVLHIMSIYLAFTRCGQVWSLDSRRARRTAAGADGRDRDPVGIALWTVFALVLLWVTALGDLSGFWAIALWTALAAQAAWWLVRRHAPGEPRTVLDMIANLVHGGAMLVIVVEVCLVYATAGWYKIQGSRWEDGTALYYPLHLNDFTPWPALSHALAGNGLIVMLITYGTVIVQVAFPFTLFNRRVKNVLLAVMMCEHAGIAVVLGLPFFSLAMIAADAVFLPTGFLRWFGDRAVRLLRPARRVVIPRQRSADEPAASTLVR